MIFSFSSAIHFDVIAEAIILLIEYNIITLYEADFSNINPAGNLYINRVIHQCFIDVQEEGTEAAAATIVEVNKYSSGGEGTPIIFKVDRPFLFLIKENSTGAFIFMGKVGNPLYS